MVRGVLTFLLMAVESSSCLKRGLGLVGRSKDACIDGVYFFLGNLKKLRHRRGGIELYKAFSSCYLTEV